jgi:hypothetical protein
MTIRIPASSAFYYLANPQAVDSLHTVHIFTYTSFQPDNVDNATLKQHVHYLL